MEKVIVRNCPSPTGALHIGTLRTALYNYLFAKGNNGEIKYRSEDTDKERSKSEYEKDIFSGLVKTGMIEPRTKIYRQSEQTAKYRKYLEELIEKDLAYYCFMTKEELDAERAEQIKKKQAPRYSGKYRDYPKSDAKKRVANGDAFVIRLKVPENKEIKFSDLIRGENKTNTKDLADFVIAKDLDTPLYNFVVVIDDHEMEITHVIRGEDHLPNTPKQIILYEMFGWKSPQFAHLPLILNSDKSKLSKRKNKTSVNDYLEEGYLKEALLNFLVLLGWNDGTENEIFSIAEMLEKFTLDRVHKGGAVFDLRKLEWLNGMYIRNMENNDFIEVCRPYLENSRINTVIEDEGSDFYEKCLLSVKEKMKKLSEHDELIHFYYEDIPATKELICNPKMKVDEQVAKTALENSMQVLESISEWSEDNIKNSLIAKIKELGLKNGQVLWPLRAALTGVAASPGAFEVAYIFGKERSLEKISRSIDLF